MLPLLRGRTSLLRLLAPVVAAFSLLPAVSAVPAPEKKFFAFPLDMIIPAAPEYQRRGEASMVPLKNGNVLFMWCDLVGRSDNARGSISGVEVSPEGKLLGQPRTIFPTPEGGLNTLSPALRRLKNGQIGVAFSYRMSTKVASRQFATSSDEGKTWSTPVIVSDGTSTYMTGCNDRLTVLESGRLVAPLHCSDDWDKHHWMVKTSWSDDHGATWHTTKEAIELPYVRWQTKKVVMESGPHEPGIAQRADGSLLMTMRTSMGTQFYAESFDQGETWTEPKSLEVISPLAPANLSRIPGTNKMLLVWTPNFDADASLMGRRNTIMMCVSEDGGRTWPHAKRKVLLHDPGRSIDYASVMYFNDEIWMTFRVASGPGVLQGEIGTGLIRVPLSWLK